MININPSESNFDECLSSLQFGERCRNFEPKARLVNEDIMATPSMTNVGNSEKMLKKM